MRVGCSLWNVAGEYALDHAKRLTAAGVNLFHWDRTDGVFAAAGGFTAAEASSISSQTGTRSEAHLMLTDPLAEVDQWCEFCELVAVPVEVDTCRAAIRRIEKRGCQAAVAISPRTSLAALADYVSLAVLLMAITPGLAGSPPDPNVFARAAALRDHPLRGIDGSMTTELFPAAIQAGVGWISVGTALVSAPDPAEWLHRAD